MSYTIIDKQGLELLNDEHESGLGAKFVEFIFYITGENFDVANKVLDSVDWGFRDEDFPDLYQKRYNKSKFREFMTHVLVRLQKLNDNMLGIYYPDELFDLVFVKYSPDLSIPRIER